MAQEYLLKSGGEIIEICKDQVQALYPSSSDRSLINIDITSILTESHLYHTIDASNNILVNYELHQFIIWEGADFDINFDFSYDSGNISPLSITLHISEVSNNDYWKYLEYSVGDASINASNKIIYEIKSFYPINEIDFLKTIIQINDEESTDWNFLTGGPGKSFTGEYSLSSLPNILRLPSFDFKVLMVHDNDGNYVENFSPVTKTVTNSLYYKNLGFATEPTFSIVSDKLEIKLTSQYALSGNEDVEISFKLDGYGKNGILVPNGSKTIFTGYFDFDKNLYNHKVEDLIITITGDQIATKNIYDFIFPNYCKYIDYSEPIDTIFSNIDILDLIPWYITDDILLSDQDKFSAKLVIKDLNSIVKFDETLPVSLIDATNGTNNIKWNLNVHKDDFYIDTYHNNAVIQLLYDDEIIPSATKTFDFIYEYSVALASVTYDTVNKQITLSFDKEFDDDLTNHYPGLFELNFKPLPEIIPSTTYLIYPQSNNALNTSNFSKVDNKTYTLDVNMTGNCDATLELNKLDFNSSTSSMQLNPIDDQNSEVVTNFVYEAPKEIESIRIKGNNSTDRGDHNDYSLVIEIKSGKPVILKDDYSWKLIGNMSNDTKISPYGQPDAHPRATLNIGALETNSIIQIYVFKQNEQIINASKDITVVFANVSHDPTISGATSGITSYSTYLSGLKDHSDNFSGWISGVEYYSQNISGDVSGIEYYIKNTFSGNINTQISNAISVDNTTDYSKISGDVSNLSGNIQNQINNSILSLVSSEAVSGHINQVSGILKETLSGHQYILSMWDRILFATGVGDYTHPDGGRGALPAIFGESGINERLSGVLYFISGLQNIPEDTTPGETSGHQLLMQSLSFDNVMETDAISSYVVDINNGEKFCTSIDISGLISGIAAIDNAVVEEETILDEEGEDIATGRFLMRNRVYDGIGIEGNDPDDDTISGMNIVGMHNELVNLNTGDIEYEPVNLNLNTIEDLLDEMIETVQLGNNNVIAVGKKLWKFLEDANNYKYTITYNIGEGTGTIPPTVTDLTYGQVIYLPDNSFTPTSPPGKNFQGWFDNNTSVKYDPGEEFTVEGNVNFVANYW
jgi:hypothetical protein